METTTTPWTARLALQGWAAGQLTWTELQTTLASTGTTQTEAEALALELGL